MGLSTVVAALFTQVASMGKQGSLGCSKSANNLCGDEQHALSALVTGAGGSGTNSIAALFIKHGLHIPHENVGKDGSVSWTYAVNVSNSAPQLPKTEPCNQYTMYKAPGVTYRNIFHVVRCPIDTISALLSHSECSWQYLKETLQINGSFAAGVSGKQQPDTKVFLAKSWLKLNQHIEKSTTKRYRLDELSQLFSDVCHVAGRSKEECAKVELPSAKNHRSHATITWAEMRKLDKNLAAELYAKAKNYGFGEDCLGNHAAAASYLRKNTEPVQTHVNCDARQCLDEDGVLWAY